VRKGGDHRRSKPRIANHEGRDGPRRNRPKLPSDTCVLYGSRHLHAHAVPRL